MRSWVLTALLLSGCDWNERQRCRRIVTERDPHTYVMTGWAVHALETWLGCEAWRPLVYGGGRGDWRWNFPRYGTVTVRTDESFVNRGLARYGVKGARIVVGPDVPLTVYMHELLHAMGESHQAAGIMAPTVGRDTRAVLEATPEAYRLKLRGLCFGGLGKGKYRPDALGRDGSHPADGSVGGVD